jgi:hypothetical protein
VPAIFAVAASEIPAAPSLRVGPLTVERAELFAAPALVADRRAGDALAVDLALAGEREDGEEDLFFAIAYSSF